MTLDLFVLKNNYKGTLLCSEWYLKSNSITAGGVFLIVEVFQPVKRNGRIRISHFKTPEQAIAGQSMTLQKSRTTTNRTKVTHCPFAWWTVLCSQLGLLLKWLIILSVVVTGYRTREGEGHAKKTVHSQLLLRQSFLGGAGSRDSLTHICVPIFKYINSVIKTFNKNERS